MFRGLSGGADGTTTDSVSDESLGLSPKHGGADGTRPVVEPCMAKRPKAAELQDSTTDSVSDESLGLSPKHGGADGTRTRGLRRDRPAL